MVSGLYLSRPLRIASMCSGLSDAKSKGIPILASSKGTANAVVKDIATRK